MVYNLWLYVSTHLNKRYSEKDMLEMEDYGLSDHTRFCSSMFAFMRE